MMVVFDQNGDGYVYNPISNLVTKVPNFSPTTKGVIWETFELNKVINFHKTNEKIFLKIK
jgi:WD repeat-containing protein 19